MNLLSNLTHDLFVQIAVWSGLWLFSLDTIFSFIFHFYFLVGRYLFALEPYFFANASLPALSPVLKLLSPQTFRLILEVKTAGGVMKKVCFIFRMGWILEPFFLCLNILELFSIVMKESCFLAPTHWRFPHHPSVSITLFLWSETSWVSALTPYVH